MKRILVANRGEIALRVMRTCRDMGIETVGIYSDADESAPHAKAADVALRIGAAAASESYLHGERIVEAARKAGADAIHPGYGFLSENAAFAKRVTDAGLTFIGPHAAAIEKMGDKIAAKAIAEEAGVPVVPGYRGDDPAAHAVKVGFPLLVKAAAGGGGKGMRLVREASGLPHALEGAAREALKAFGSGALLLEKYLENARHVEVQILGDRHGNVLHLWERECSLQRRHQKILEECPSPAVTETVREAMCRAAVGLGKAIGYDNAGTVEFLLDASGAFYFLEMNTRLQVEHPVTECVTGLDLVRLQIEIARGKAIAFGQEKVARRGHAVEVRLYAEDPARGFAPAPGTLVAWEAPTGVGVRVDGGIAAGDRIGIEYDPMLAKIIAHGEDRAEALARLDGALRRLVVAGPVTNREFLLRLVGDPDVARGDFSTAFVEPNVRRWLSRPEDGEVALALTAATARHVAGFKRALTSLPVGFRNNPYRPAVVTWGVGESEVSVSIGGARVVSAAGDLWRIEIAGVARDFRIQDEGEHVHVAFAGHAVSLRRVPPLPPRGGAEAPDGVRAPMTGRVTRLLKAAGEAVAEGDALLVLEAMKMEQTVMAPRTGTLDAILVREGDTVERGVALVRFSELTSS